MDRISRGLVVALALSSMLTGCGGGGRAVEPILSTTVPITEVPDVDAPPPTDDSKFIDRSNAIGFYTDGSVEDAASLPDEGPGYVKIFRLRNRNFATASTVQAIQFAAAAWRAEFPTGDRIQIGDMTDWNGGYLSGHASHQNGLDVDVAYLQANHVERDPNTNGPHGFREQFVSNGKVTPNFDMARNWAVFRNLVRRGNVGRIFIDPVLKNAFCKHAAGLDPTLPATTRNEILRRLRPLAAHADHFHMRMKCPPGHRKCVAQTEPPTGTGCVSAGSALEAGSADDELGEDFG